MRSRRLITVTTALALATVLATLFVSRQWVTEAEPAPCPKQRCVCSPQPEWRSGEQLNPTSLPTDVPAPPYPSLTDAPSDTPEATSPPPTDSPVAVGPEFRRLKGTAEYEAIAYFADEFEPFETAPSDSKPEPTTSTKLMPVVESYGRHNAIDISELAVSDHKAKWVPPRNGRLYCELALLHSRQCGDDESAVECVERLGKSRVAAGISVRCNASAWFRQLKVRRRKTPDSGPFDAGLIPRSFIRGTPPAYIEPAARIVMPMPPPRHWPSIDRTVHRLPMAIPEEAIVERVPRNKLFDWNPHLPAPFPFNEKSTYSLGRQDEMVAREMASLSYFSWTHRRGCWTAQRHLDILAAGGVPFFIDLARCRDLDQCLPGYPSKLVLAATKLPGVAELLTHRWGEFVAAPLRYSSHYVFNPVRLGEINWTVFDKAQYFSLADQLLQYTQKYLTTKALAAHFLQAMGRPQAKVVFVTSNWWLPHTVSLIHGLASLGLTVYTNVGRELNKMPNGTSEEQIATTRAEIFFAGFRAAGHLYGMRTDPTNLRLCRVEVDCLEKLKSGEIELVAYCVSNNLNNADYYDEYVRDNFDERRVAFIDGLDQGVTFEQHFAHVLKKNHTLFSREAHHVDVAYE